MNHRLLYSPYLRLVNNFSRYFEMFDGMATSARKPHPSSSRTSSSATAVDLIGKGCAGAIGADAELGESSGGYVGARCNDCGGTFVPAGEQSDRVAGERMTAQAVFNTVKSYATAIGIDHFAPHDLRRSYAKLAHKGRTPLEQIQLSLGHASIQTTERYLGVEQDFTDAPAITWACGFPGCDVSCVISQAACCGSTRCCVD